MTDRFVVIVTGWRGATAERDGELISAALHPIYLSRDQVILRHGKCKYGGVDLIADGLARAWGWGVEAWPAEERNGRILGSPRNRAMCAASPRADVVVAFPGPGSRGTWDCLHWAARFGIRFEGHPIDR